MTSQPAQPAQLCSECRIIFSLPTALTYGTFSHWSRRVDLDERSSCHLCNILGLAWRRLGREKSTVSHDRPVRYALKVFNDGWARYGDEPEWPTLDFDGDYDNEDGVTRAKLQAQTDPTDYGLAKLLSTDAVELTDGSIEFWLNMVFADYLGNSIVLPLEIQTDNEAEAIAQINLEHQSSSGTPENMRLAKHWLDSCLENHPRCRPSAHSNSTGWLPTRLLHVGLETSFRLRLVSTARYDPSEVSYAALSYRWGDQSDFRLTMANSQRYHESIEFCALSKTLQEAVQTCRSIGLEYLWVDALCIVQDDFHDWSREADVMSTVYGSATCTIAAANSGDFERGSCFATRNPYQVRPCSVPNPLNPSTSKHRFYIRPRFLRDIFEEEVRKSAWYTRGWVFQERILSSRMLIFGKTQMLWSCQEIQAAETWPSGKTSENFIDQFDSFEVEKARFQKLLDPSRHVTDVNDRWAVLLKDYAASSNNFTKMSDRLVALQGLVLQIREATGRQYCAGFWLDDSLPASLLWIALDRIHTLERPIDNRAPSWSWASLDGAIQFNTGRFKGLAAIRHIRIPDVENHATDHREGLAPRLQASGLVLRVSIRYGSSLVGPSLFVYDWNWRPPPQQNPIIRKIQSTSKDIIHRMQPKAEKIISKIRSAAEKTISYVKEITRKPRSALSSIWFTAYWCLEPPLEMFMAVFCLLPLLALAGFKAALGILRARLRGSNDKMVPSVDEDPDLRASCFFDSPLYGLYFDRDAPTFIIPVLNGYQTSGLIVQPVPGVVEGYQRIGAFEMNSFKLERFKSGSEDLLERNFCLM